MRRQDEQLAIDSLFNILVKEGKNPIEDKAIQDNPDCVLEVSGNRISLDCTNINFEALLKWTNSRKRFIKGQDYEIKFALEPHYWIKNSLQEKESKIDTYQKNGNSKEVWLIAHALEFPEFFDCTQSIISIMKDAVRFINPKFDEVWFVHSKWPATRLWTKGETKLSEFPRWDTTKQEYPFESIIQFTDTITKDGLTKEVKFGGSFEQLLIEPLDKNWDQ